MLISVLIFPDIFNTLPSLIGKDITFTGRTYLWAAIWEVIKKHILIGCGFQGYWVISNKDLLELYKNFVWLPNQAHNGYLDILNEIGIVGLVLFAISGFELLYKLNATS